MGSSGVLWFRILHHQAGSNSRRWSYRVRGRSRAFDPPHRNHGDAPVAQKLSSAQDVSSIGRHGKGVLALRRFELEQHPCAHNGPVPAPAGFHGSGQVAPPRIQHAGPRRIDALHDQATPEAFVPGPLPAPQDRGRFPWEVGGGPTRGGGEREGSLRWGGRLADSEGWLPLGRVGPRGPLRRPGRTHGLVPERPKASERGLDDLGELYRIFEQVGVHPAP
jgi:hypothetical protein